MTFYDRADELDALEMALESAGHAFYVVYKRSRTSASGLDPEGEGRTLIRQSTVSTDTVAT